MPTLQDLQAQDAAYAKAGNDAQTAEQAKQTFGSTGQPNGILSWMTQMPKRITSDMIDSAVRAADSMAHDGSWGEAATRVGRDVAAGAADAVANTGDAAEELVRNGARATYESVAHPQQAALEAEDPAMQARDRMLDGSNQTSPIWQHARSAILDFRDAVAVKDPNLVDGLTQSVAQLAIPFAGYSKALSGVHDAAIAAQGLEDIPATQSFGKFLADNARKDLTGFATKVAAPGAVTDATALQPHSMRFADLIALGKHTEGKLGDVLNALAPDGSALDSYIRYITDRSDEGEAEGRWKNVLDGFGVNLLATPLITAAGSVLKQGTAGLRYLIDNGVASSGDIVGIRPQMQRGAVGDLSTKPAAPAQDRMTRMMQMLHEQQHTKGAGVQYFANGDLHTATSDNGVTTAMRQGKNLRIIDTETFKGARGKGEGAARIERLLQEARAKGLTLTSDSQVSAPAQKVYERLRDMGYDIKENPSRLDPGTGEKFSTSELKGVYEIGPKAEKH